MSELFEGLDKSVFQWFVYYFLTTVVTYIAFKFKSVKKELEINKSKHIALESALCAIIRNEIIKTYNHYMEKGYMSIHERDNLEKMFDNYTLLGGNGTIPDMVASLFKLPIHQ